MEENLCCNRKHLRNNDFAKWIKRHSVFEFQSCRLVPGSWPALAKLLSTRNSGPERTASGSMVYELRELPGAFWLDGVDPHCICLGWQVACEIA